MAIPAGNRRVSSLRLTPMKAFLPLLVVLAACSSTDTEPVTTVTAATTSTTVPAPTTVGEAELVMTISELGGCNWMGPNCRTFGLWSDGTAAVYRFSAELPTESLDRDEAVDVAAVGTALADELMGIANTIDFDELESRLAPGSCQACVDGIDYVLTLHTASGTRHLSSNEFRFDQTEPLFAAVDETLTAMSETLQFEVQSWS